MREAAAVVEMTCALMKIEESKKARKIVKDENDGLLLFLSSSVRGVMYFVQTHFSRKRTKIEDSVYH